VLTESFAEVKVIGQVRIRKTTSYEEWALEILVKFRDSEDLQVLSHKRQSGGVSRLVSRGSTDHIQIIS